MSAQADASLTAFPSRPARRGSRPKGVPYWVSSLILLVAWWVGSATGAIDPTVLPGPVAVWQAGVELAQTGLLWNSLVASISRIVVGTVIGLVGGVVLGLAAGTVTTAEIVVDRPIQMLRVIPFNALAPLLIIVLGIGEPMKISLIVIGVFVPVYLNAFAGVRGIDPKLLELARVYRVRRPVVLVRVLFQGSLASILTGLRFSLAIGWIALVTSETVNAQSGVGYILAQAQQFVRTDRVVLCIVIYAVLGLLTDWLVRLLERRLLRWRRS